MATRSRLTPGPFWNGAFGLAGIFGGNFPADRVGNLVWTSVFAGGRLCDRNWCAVGQPHDDAADRRAPSTGVSDRMSTQGTAAAPLFRRGPAANGR